MEILAPAGNFDVAIAAYQSGADAVYLGLTNFSARKRADNFSDLDLRRLKKYALEHRKKIYITINTLIKDEEFGELYETLEFIDDLNIDGVIIQDFGVINFIRRTFPKIILHGSTQMAIHTLEGARFAWSMGFTRVVLSRECGLDVMEEIRKELPELEIEVFIHGALCYGFSGLCLASGMLLDRSGNRGECAQICRTYFENKSHEKSFPFSCNDLAARELILKLKDLGIASFKIEGRMKGIPYVQSVVKYYRALLDGIPADRLIYKLNDARVAFSRKLTFGRFLEYRPKGITNVKYPGHMGVEAGTMIRERGQLMLAAIIPLSIFETVAFFRNGELITRAQLKKISVRKKRTEKINPGDHASFLVPDEVKEGDDVYLVSKSEKAPNALDKKLFAPFKREEQLTVKLAKNEIAFSGKNINKTFAIELLKRSGDKMLSTALQEQLDKSDDAKVTFTHVFSKDTDPSLIADGFILPKVLKDIRRQLYEEISIAKTEKHFFTPRSFESKIDLSDRDALFLEDETPFVQDALDLDLKVLKRLNDYVVIPIDPVMIHEKVFLEKLDTFLKTNSSVKFLLGLGNIGHLHLLKKYENFDNVDFFLDYGLYVANKYALDYFSSLSDKIVSIYSWCEMKNKIPGCAQIKDPKHLPLFISLNCFNLSRGGSCNNCPRSYKEFLTNGQNKFKVIVKRCYTYLFLRD